MRRCLALGLLGLCLLPAVIAGCAKKKIVAVANLPPETIMFVDRTVTLSPPATVNHIVHLYWFGSDPDGEVAGYWWRFAPSETTSTLIAPYRGTTRTDSVFTLLVPTGVDTVWFQIYAVDEHGLADLSPAVQRMSFSNKAPSVRIDNAYRLVPGDTTYASATFFWTGRDSDGVVSAMSYEIALDSLGRIPSTRHTVVGNSFTIPADEFKDGGVYPATRPRMAFIRAIDDGGRASGWDSVRWVVREPATPGIPARLLLIDDVPGGGGAHDNLYRGAASDLQVGSYSILRLELTQPFRSSQDLLQTFRQFDAVVWYRGIEGQGTPPRPSGVMRAYQDGMAAYLDGGGKLMLESLYLIDGEEGDALAPLAPGALRKDWATRYFGSDGLIRHVRAGFTDSTSDWSTNPPTILQSPVFDDSLGNFNNMAGLRGFAVRDPAYVALVTPGSQLTPPVPLDLPVAVTVPVPGGGRVVAITFSIAASNGFGNRSRFLCKVFRHLGLGTGPCPP